MADLADRAQQHHDREEALLRAQNRKSVLMPCGRCHNCREPITLPLFCDTDCRDDYEYRQERGIA